MTLPDWLEEAYAEGRISIAEALNVNRSKDPNWKILLTDYNLPFSDAKEVVKNMENSRRPLEKAVAFVLSPRPDDESRRAREKSLRADEGSRRVRQEDKIISEKLGKDLLNELEEAEAARKRGPLEQIRFFIDSWEFNYVRKHAYISNVDAKALRILIKEARREIRTLADAELVKRADGVAGAIRRRGLMPLNQRPHLIFTPSGGSPKRK
jgi:hypothetical protein